MIWFLTPLPTGRTHARCRLCGDEGTHMNDRAAEMWARYHDPVQCGRRARVQKAALTPVAGSLAASHVENGHAPIQTTAARTGAVATSEEIAS